MRRGSQDPASVPMFMPEMFSKLSVRARIVVLAVIPVIGFLAIGLAYMTGDFEVGHAFDSVHRDSAVADASRDLKTGLLMMRAATTEYVARPSDQEVQDFAEGQDLAIKSIDRIAGGARRVRAGCHYAAAHHRARSQDQLRKPGQRAEIAGLYRTRRRQCRAQRRQHGGREDHSRRFVVGRRRRRRAAPDVAFDHAPRRDRIPAHTRARLPKGTFSTR